MSDEELVVVCRGERIVVRLRTPAPLAADPLLLINFALDRHTTLNAVPYCLISDRFFADGHRVASFDLPYHGDRVNGSEFGEGLPGMAAATATGLDPFATVVDDCRAVIDRLVETNRATAGRIAVSGISRGGLCALHALAQDRRIAAGAVFAPVTYVPALTEFVCLADSQIVRHASALSLVPALADRRVFIAISSDDPRVGTDHCRRFVRALGSEGRDHHEFVVVPGETHALPHALYSEGADWLVKTLSAS